VGEDSNESGVCPEGVATGSPEGGGSMSNVIRIDEERIKGHLDRIVRASVEEMRRPPIGPSFERRVFQRVKRSPTLPHWKPEFSTS